MQVPQEVRDLCFRASCEFKNDIPAAVEKAKALLRESPLYSEWVEALIHNSVQELIYDARHASNERIKEETGYRDTKSSSGSSSTSTKTPGGDGPKQSYAGTNSVNKVLDIYNFRMDGSTLGELTGDQVEALACKEESISLGHMFNAKLLRWCKAQGVVGAVKVRDKVKAQKLYDNFHRIQREVYGNTAG